MFATSARWVYGSALGLAAAFWLVESVLDAYVFEHMDLSDGVLGLHPNEGWMRLVVVALIFLMAFGVQRTLRNRARMVAGLRACQARLQQEVAERSEALEERGAKLARLRERERLARELHDTVSQNLFSAGLLADSSSRLLDNDPEEARRQIEQTRRLIRGSLAELRILLLELRPSSIARGNLGDLLRQMARSIGEQGQVEVAAEINGHCNPPPARKVALYRIAQEALNNALKHADASRIRMRLEQAGEGFLLQVEDDGTGFDPDAVPPGSGIGLEIMRERARSARIALDIVSHPEGGTRVMALWKEEPMVLDASA